MKVLAIVPARCGSKGFSHKNIARLGEMTLLELAVKVGIDCPDITDLYVSTDCQKYEDIAISFGAKSLGLRPKYLAGDDAKTIDVVLNLLETLSEEYEFIVLLQPTSPVRTPQDISEMLRLIREKEADACVSVQKIEEPHPYKLKKVSAEGYVSSFLDGKTSEVPRQQLPSVYALTGAVYIVKVEALKQTKSFFPKKTIAYEIPMSVNVDTEEDFIFLEAMYKRQRIKIWGLNEE